MWNDTHFWGYTGDFNSWLWFLSQKPTSMHGLLLYIGHHYLQLQNSGQSKSHPLWVPLGHERIKENTLSMKSTPNWKCIYNWNKKTDTNAQTETHAGGEKDEKEVWIATTKTKRQIRKPTYLNDYVWGRVCEFNF